MADDDETDEILNAVGLALHKWSRVEGEVISVLWRCMETRTPAPATIVWSSVVNLRSKLVIVKQMLPLFLSDEQALGLWSKISDAIQRRGQKRNGLAHYQIVRFDAGERLVPGYQSAGMGKLVHADTNADNAFRRALELFDTRGYTAADIRRIAQDFEELKDTVSWYRLWVIEFKRIPLELDLTPIPPLVRRFLASQSE